MQDRSHRQQPILGLVPLPGEGRSVAELEREALDELREVAEKHLSLLSGSDSPWLRYLASVQSNASALQAVPRLPHVRLA